MNERITSKPKPGTLARVRNGVRPYGGRVFPVEQFVTEPNGRQVVDLYVNVIHGYGADIRIYDIADVEILVPKS